jgi:hypothetical protein
LNVYLNTTLTIQAGTVTVDQQNSITVTLKDQNGNPLATRVVQISVNGVSYANVTTGSNGQASFNWQPTSTGNYTVAASYSATGPSDSGYEPSSANMVFTVKPQTIINTQTTGSGTQSVTMQTAQNSVAATLGPPSYSLQFSLGSIALTVHFNGKTAQTTATLRNEFGWICTAKVFGVCVMSVPFWRIHVDVSVPGVFDLDVARYVPFGPTSVSYHNGLVSPTDEQSAEAGIITSTALPLLGDLAISLGGGPENSLAVIAGGLVVGGGIAAAATAAEFTLSTSSFKSFLIGLLALVPAAILCAAQGICPPELPPLPVLEIVPVAIIAWTTYIDYGVFGPAFAIGGAQAGLFILIIMAFLADLYTLI